MSYKRGSHIIASLTTDRNEYLDFYDPFKVVLDGLIVEHGLCKLGEVYHNFSPTGFTAVVCLSESHISVHTWPEWGRVNLDIYLSNHLRENGNIVVKIYEALITYFHGSVEKTDTIYR